METFELLDRFEILFPTRSNVTNLRRAYIDKDISSIFRLTTKDDELRKAVMEKNLHSIFRVIEKYDTEELRKAVIEQNLHSIFRLTQDEDLRKLILEDNTWKLWGVLSRYLDTQFVAAFKSFFVNDTKYDKDCFSRGQLLSKLWLVKELKRTKLDLGTVFLCAGWYATLAVMLFEKDFKIEKIRSFDVDPTTADIAEIFNKPWVVDDWKFKASIQNIYDIDYQQHTYPVKRSDGSELNLTDAPDTIINTSCEHLEDFQGWYNKIPNGKLVIIQANDFHDVDEHVNTYNTVEEFSASAPMSEILYKGELELEKYKRFMLIGYK